MRERQTEEKTRFVFSIRHINKTETKVSDPTTWWIYLNQKLLLGYF